jgi:hypothetical protein
MILGALATIGFVAGDSTCNGATNLSSPSGGPTTGSFCGHAHGLLTVSFIVLVIGALLVTVGSLVLPILRDRDARQAAAKSPAAVAASVEDGSMEP